MIFTIVIIYYCNKEEVAFHCYLVKQLLNEVQLHYLTKQTQFIQSTTTTTTHELVQVNKYQFDLMYQDQWHENHNLMHK